MAIGESPTVHAEHSKCHRLGAIRNFGVLRQKLTPPCFMRLRDWTPTCFAPIAYPFGDSTITEIFGMIYCSSCGQPSTPLARLCTSCGTSVARKSLVPLSAVQSSITQIEIIEPKHGGMLAFEGFVLSFVASLPGVLALSSDKGNPDVGLWWSGIALVIGAAYIALSLMKWNQQPDKVNREDLAWIVAVLLGCVSVGGFIL